MRKTFRIWSKFEVVALLNDLFLFETLLTNIFRRTYLTKGHSFLEERKSESSEIHFWTLELAGGGRVRLFLWLIGGRVERKINKSRRRMVTDFQWLPQIGPILPHKPIQTSLSNVLPAYQTNAHTPLTLSNQLGTPKSSFVMPIRWLHNYWLLQKLKWFLNRWLFHQDSFSHWLSVKDKLKNHLFLAADH